MAENDKALYAFHRGEPLGDFGIGCVVDLAIPRESSDGCRAEAAKVHGLHLISPPYQLLSLIDQQMGSLMGTFPLSIFITLESTAFFVQCGVRTAITRVGMEKR
jgi:hypothetical protein